MADSDDGFAAPVKLVRASHSRIRDLAPKEERVLTIACNRRVVGAVWPKWSPDKSLVTALGITPLETVRRHVIAPCGCGAGQHLLDLDKVAAAVRSSRRAAGTKPPGRPPEVSVSAVSVVRSGM